jgi:uncharacterized integral membrane protein (TIGR00698 family)
LTLARGTPPASRVQTIARALPGIGIAAAIAAVAFLVSGTIVQIPLNPIMLAVLIGALVSGVAGSPAWMVQGLDDIPRLALRTAIVLLGFQISFLDVSSIGATGLVVVIAGTITTMIVTVAAGRALGLARDQTLLIAAGTSICGVAAVVAMGAAIRASARDMTYAIICVTLFGLLSMVLFPLIGSLLGLEPRMFGIWTGAAVHEVAQVVAAGFQHSKVAGEVATITKLSRVLLLAPVVAAVAFSLRREASQKSAPVLPWFLAGFMAAVIANSLLSIPPEARAVIALAASVLFTFALAAIGLAINPRQFLSGRGKELVLGLIATVWVGGAVLALVLISG